jgi:hypothetical protein
MLSARPEGSRRDALLVTGALLVALGLGLWLRWPVVFSGYRDDDYVQLAMLRGEFVVQRPSWDLFWFGGRSRQEELALMDFGYHPWWAQPGLRLSMFRPLSSLLIALDFRLFGADPVAAHLHSFGWWVLLMLCAALLLRRLLPAGAAALAIVLFALEEAHGVPLGWLANRSTLVATSFSVLGLYAHLRWRRDGWQPGRRLALLGFGLGLMAGEYALTAFAYLVSFEALGMRDAPRARLRAAALPLALALGYLAVRAALGHGLAGSGFYISPGAAPFEFLLAAVQRVPVLVADLLFGVPASWWIGGSPWRSMLLDAQWFDAATWRRLPDWHFWHWLIGLAALLFCLGLLRFVRRGCPPETRRELGWLLAGALLSLVPAAGSLPGDRLLSAASLAACALSALTVTEAARRVREGVRERRYIGALFALSLAGLVGFLQIAQAGLRSGQEAYGFGARSEALRRWSLRAELPSEHPERQRIVLVQAADFTTAANLPWVRLQAGLPLPRYYRRLSGAFQAHDIRRVSDQALELTVLSNQVDDSAAGTLYRSRGERFHDGQRITLPGMQVELLRTLHGNPFRTRFTFDVSLDSPDFVLLCSAPAGLLRVPIPKVGERVRLPRASYPNL